MSGEEPSDEINVEIFVSNRASELAEARALAEQRREEELDYLLQHPELIDYPGGRLHAMVLAAGSRAREQLRARALDESQQPHDRASAVGALIQLDDPRIEFIFKQVLAQTPDTYARDFLWRMNIPMEFSRNNAWQKVSALPEFHDWLRRQLRDADQNVRETAFQVIAIVALKIDPADFPPVDSEAEDPDGRMAFWRVRLAPSSDVFETILRRIEADPSRENTWPWVALSDLPPCKDRALADRAIRAATAYLRLPSVGISTGQSAAMEVAKAHGSVSPNGAFGELLSAQPPTAIRSAAIEELAKRDPAAALEQAKELYLAEPRARAAAATMIGSIARGSEDEQLVRLLTRPMISTFTRPALSAAVGALLSIGGEAANTAAYALADHLDDEQAILAAWRRHGITPRIAANRLARLGVVTSEQASRGLARYLANVDHPYTDFVAEFFRGAGLWFGFDAESSRIPPRYDHLLLDFADASQQAFHPEAATQDLRYYRIDEPNRNGHFTVQFIHAGRLFRFHPKAMGDWIDVPPLFAVVNYALEVAGGAKRFVPLNTQDQWQGFIFVEPNLFASAAKELHLPLSKDLTRAMRNGASFEQFVRGHLDLS